jgi:hypothetical protein
MKIKTTTSYEVELTKEELDFIKCLVQNPTCPPMDEAITDRDMRMRIWAALGGM